MSSNLPYISIQKYVSKIPCVQIPSQGMLFVTELVLENSCRVFYPISRENIRNDYQGFPANDSTVGASTSDLPSLIHFNEEYRRKEQPKST